MSPFPDVPDPPAGPAVLPEDGAGLLRAARWSQARAVFRALGGAGGARAQEGIADASWWLDDAEECLAARERAYRMHQDAGDVVGAARAATALGYDSALFGQGAAVARGWSGRARELLDGVPAPSPEHGWLEVREAELALHVTHRPLEAVRSARRALETADRCGDRVLHCVASGLLGLAEVMTGRLETGMQRLDTAVAAALAGDVGDLMWVGKTCCWLVVACRGAQDQARALEWCARVEELCRERDLAPLFTACRIQYASVRLEGGHWDEAEETLVAALEDTRGSQRRTRVEAVVQLGHLRRRQGRLREADELYEQAPYVPEAVVGSALVRLAEGDPRAAWSCAAQALADVEPVDRLRRAALLLPAVRCAAAAGAPEEAAALTAELREVARTTGLSAVRGAADVATAVTVGPEAAPRFWRSAARSFHEAGLPVEEAECRTALATALEATDRSAAVREARAAVTVLDGVEAPGRLDAALELRDRLAVGHTGPPSPLTARETEVLALVARGLTTAGIAEALVVSEHTVHRHVANVLAKLDERTRAAAVAHASREGFL